MEVDKLTALKEKREVAVSEMEGITTTAEAELRGTTNEENERFDALNQECELLARQIKCEEALVRRRAEIADGRREPVIPRVLSAPQPASSLPEEQAVSIPTTVKRWGNLKSFKGSASDVKAYKAGMFYLACAGNARAQGWLRDRGIAFTAAAQTEGTNTAGGYLVYDELDNAIIDLRDQYGVFSRNARRVAMSSDIMNRPRRTGGLTAYFVGEDTAVTESSKTWDKVQLSAKKLGCLARISNELGEDAIINVADDLTNEIAWAFAKKIDECGFVGDGTSTYSGITGVSVRLADLNGIDDGGGLVKSADNVFADFVLGDFTKMISILPSYAQTRARWYCSNAVWGQTMLRLASAGGGNTFVDLERGGRKQFLGYPVEVTQTLPTSDSNSQICCLFGDLALSSDFGDRRTTTMRFSDSAYVGSASVFERDEIALIGTIRFDINNHDLGTASAAGPVVGLISHSA